MERPANAALVEFIAGAFDVARARVHLEQGLASRDKRPFRKPEEVLRVKGLTPGWFSKVKGMVSAGEAPAAQRPPEAGRTAKGG